MKYFLRITSFLLLGSLLACQSTTSKKEVAAQDQYRRGELPVQEGMALFNQNCASCHNFSSNEIGPNLSGITAAVSKDWLKQFIQNPQQMIADGDERASAQFEKFKVYMPAFSQFDDNQLENLLGFIHKFSEGEKRNKSNRKGGLVNPIPEKIAPATHALVVEDFVTLPASAPNAPDTRVNTFRPLQTKQKERLFVADLRGVLFEIMDGKPQPFLDMNQWVGNFIDRPGLGSGLGSFAFHPEFERNGLLYTTHTEPANTQKADFAVPEGTKSTLQWVISEWQMEDPNAGVFAGQRRELLRVDMVTGIHGFQDLTFNPTAKPGSADYGLLYLGIGDGGAALAGHPEICQNETSIWGSIIRIDPSGNNSKNKNYGIPKDNPYADQPNKVGEIWSRGFRNPHRIAWNEKGEKMLVSNIGQHSVEEVNLITKGGDFGWPYREGSFVFDVNANPEMVYPLDQEEKGSFLNPVIQYDHDEGNAVSGGYFYWGKKIPSLKGKYIFGDIARGTLFMTDEAQLEQGKAAPLQKVNLVVNGTPTSFQEIRPNERVDLRFGQDHKGDLYVFTKSNGKVYRVMDFIKI
ncbi:MAG: PQQ-dependent sugar dehydrogenase [Flavobacteriaceae bacterium]